MSGSANDIISSGILDLYVAGALTHDEISDVERAIASSPEVAAEVRRLQSTLEQYAQLHSTQPRPELRSRVLQAITDAQQAETKQVETKQVETQQTETQHEAKHTTHVQTGLHRVDGGLAGDNDVASSRTEATARETQRVERMPAKSNRWMLAASVAFILGLLPSMYFYMQYNGVRAELSQTKVELAEVKNAQSVMASKALFMEGALGKVADTNVTRVAMPVTTSAQAALPGMSNAQNAFATVWWNKGTDEVMLDLRKMPECPAGHDYQLWAIVDGKPVDLGVFNPASERGTMVAMHTVGKPQLFAVTVEPKGGSPSPTLDKMIVAGAVRSS